MSFLLCSRKLIKKDKRTLGKILQDILPVHGVVGYQFEQWRQLRLHLNEILSKVHHTSTTSRLKAHQVLLPYCAMRLDDAFAFLKIHIMYSIMQQFVRVR